MEQAASDISRNLYADYGAVAVLVLFSIGSNLALFRYFTTELRLREERREKSESEWKQRYDSLLDRMLKQADDWGSALERLADRRPAK